MTQAASLSDRLSRELPELLQLRRHLHAHPELSGEEHQTAALVAGELRQLGWRVREGVGRTGVVAELGPDYGPTVGLRVATGMHQTLPGGGIAQPGALLHRQGIHVHP